MTIRCTEASKVDALVSWENGLPTVRTTLLFALAHAFATDITRLQLRRREPRHRNLGDAFYPPTKFALRYRTACFPLVMGEMGATTRPAAGRRTKHKRQRPFGALMVHTSDRPYSSSLPCLCFFSPPGRLTSTRTATTLQKMARGHARSNNTEQLARSAEVHDDTKRLTTRVVLRPSDTTTHPRTALLALISPSRKRKARNRPRLTNARRRQDFRRR